jgi:cold shock CspA family protein
MHKQEKGEIVIWHREARWGFAATPEGKNFFVHESAFRDHRQVARVRYGTLIEFDLPVAQTAEQAFLDKLNSGKYRDDPSIARSHRNPRRVVTGKKPRAANVVVIEGGRANE